MTYRLGVLSVQAIFLFLISLSFFSYVHGATEDFILQQLVGGDTTPPSVPGNFTATPVSISQIDLAWDASTDNYLMGGYQIWRDDAFLATTTLTSYSDAGLTASTSYTYFIFAFDSFFNYSASTSPVTTTTLQIPPVTGTTTPTTTTTGTTGSRLRPIPDQIQTLEIIPDRESVTITYVTVGHVRSVIKWGRTSTYELGSLGERIFSRNHETKITGLTPGTRYYFTIEGENKYGRYDTMYQGSFVTLDREDIFPPGNVRDFTGRIEETDIVLSWINPNDPDFAKVRILRGDSFYPTDTADGWLVYEGNGASFRDTDVLETRDGAYYTIFTYDEKGNISSGAVVSVFKEGVTPPVIVVPTENTLALTFPDIVFTQDGNVLTVDENQVTIDGAKALTIGIPYERLPEHLKTILVTLYEGVGSDKRFSFLLRIQAGEDAYTAVIAPFGKSGTYPVELSVFDYKTAQIGYTEGYIESRLLSVAPQTIGIGAFLLAFLFRFWKIWFLILLCILIFLGYRALKRPA